MISVKTETSSKKKHRKPKIDQHEHQSTPDGHKC